MNALVCECVRVLLLCVCMCMRVCAAAVCAAVGTKAAGIRQRVLARRECARVCVHASCMCVCARACVCTAKPAGSRQQEEGGNTNLVQRTFVSMS